MIALLFFVVALFANPAHAFLFATGSYTGNATDNRTIDISATSVGGVADFQPDLVLVKCDNAERLNWRSSAMTGDISFILGGNLNGFSDAIQAFNANGFQVGTLSSVNASGVTCYYAAFATDGNNDLAIGSYAGNGTDNRDITISPAFEPQFVSVKADDATSSVARWRVADHTGDLSASWSASAEATNGIQGFNANGFQVGVSENVNENLITYYYFAFKAVSSSTASGNFTGNAADNRDITVGFQPELVFLKGNSTDDHTWVRFASMSGDESCSNMGVTCTTNHIQAFAATTFQVGDDSGVNESGVTMRWYALKTPVYVPSVAKRFKTIVVD